ncbi:MAG TPA: sigma-70 family RNA polymerase sigma factor, partial [Gemmataceae bacterium]|nr:sigma-70 family RNA polymerase sigma factor [Gemmataceae bacterium]
MTKKTANGIAAFLARLGRAADGAGLPDAALLERYLACRDEAAFAALVRRHGPMVFGVCRRVLSNEADAEDAFQATFLVLATKAASIRPRGMVGNWLYGVARNIALKAKAMTRKRRTKERDAGARTAPVTKGPDSGGIMEFLDVELAALPDHYRLPILLHDLEGRTIREVASHLGWPQGTVATRLARGRAILARRLARYGLGLSGGALAAVLADRVALA